MAKSKVWDLGVYVYPGGVQYSNRARTVGGDYEKIAFVGPSGMVRWDIPRKKVDPVIRARVDLDAAETRIKYFHGLADLRAADPFRLLDRLCDMSPVDLLLDLWAFNGDTLAKIDFMVDRLVRAGRL